MLLHTISSLPILVAPLKDFKSLDNFGSGVKQYKNWQVAWGCNKVVFPKMLRPAGVTLRDDTKQKDLFLTIIIYVLIKFTIK